MAGAPTSGLFYDGRLNTHPGTATRRLAIGHATHPALKPHGLSVLAVPHAGCTQRSAEESSAIGGVLESLLKQRVVSSDAPPRSLTLDDVRIVVPFNAQLACLRRALPPGARIGTVDKFQGQEGVVVIVSMTSSTAEFAPRSLSFLFNPHRLNGAISRAQCPAVLVRGCDSEPYAEMTGYIKGADPTPRRLM